uniref:Uncharacterized protein n=1 Tax=Kalanchoe fedtschenkoi TaxID=63787 RepID=A0A7N0UKC7_KALFE
MKFGKEFESQMVPEWREAYMNYSFLKSVIKDIQAFKAKSSANHGPDHDKRPVQLSRKNSLYRTFSGLTSFPRQLHHHHHTVQVSPDPENPPPPPPPIAVKSVPDAADHKYETQFLMSGERGGEYELVFFKRLDDEFNKVSIFYKMKVEEVMAEAEELNKQMDALIAFRIKVDKPHRELMEHQEAGADSSSARHNIDVIEEGPSIHGCLSDDLGDDNGTGSGNNNGDKQCQVVARHPRQASLEILDSVSLGTDGATMRRFLSVPKQSELKFNKKNLNKAEEKLKLAFVEFYHKLRLLKSYSFLNKLAFSKIMKKYDKVTSRDASKSYLAMVEASYVGSNADVERLVERVEATFIKHFTNSNRSKGMSILRHKPKRERHSVSVLTGFLAGVTAALVVALILIIRARRLVEKEGAEKYMQTMFPLYSFFVFIVIHIVLYALNIYFWRKYKVNYAFILGFKQGTEQGYREVLLLAFGLSTLSAACVLSNLDMEMDPETKGAKALTELLPLMVLLFVIAVLFCPFNIVYRSSRYFFLKSLFHSFAAPLYKVTLPDFIVADQLTSQAQAFRSIEFYICYYGWGGYKTRENTCMTSQTYKTFYYIAGFYPFFIRFLQCVRRLVEEKDMFHFYNALKYFSTCVAVCVRTAYGINKKHEWMIAAWVTSVISGIAVTYWDIVYDWGLLQRRSKNAWLRDKLLVPYKSVYFIAIVENAILRFAWFQTVLDLNISSSQNESLIALFAILEILRRGIWNFFRLENEQLYNAGKYRAFKSVPLPFNYNEDADDKEE